MMCPGFHIQLVCYGPNCLARSHKEVRVLGLEHLLMKNCERIIEIYTDNLSAHADQTSALVSALTE